MGGADEQLVGAISINISRLHAVTEPAERPISEDGCRAGVETALQVRPRKQFDLARLRQVEVLLERLCAVESRRSSFSAIHVRMLDAFTTCCC